MFQGLAIQKLHNNESLTILVVNLVNDADVGVVQARCGFGLPLKAAQCLRISGYIIGKELQGNEAIESDILGLIDDAHGSATEFFKDAIVRDGLADQEQRAPPLEEDVRGDRRLTSTRRG